MTRAFARVLQLQLLPLLLLLLLASPAAGVHWHLGDASVRTFSQGPGTNECPPEDSRGLTKEECRPSLGYYPGTEWATIDAQAADKPVGSVDVVRDATKPKGCFHMDVAAGHALGEVDIKYCFNKHKTGRANANATLVCGLDFRTYWGERGGRCVTAAFEVDCRAEARRQGTLRRFRRVDKANYPPGCYEARGRMYYNSHHGGVASGNTSAHKKARPMCLVHKRDATALFPRAARCGNQTRPMTEGACGAYKGFNTVDGAYYTGRSRLSYGGKVKRSKRPHGCYIDTRDDKVYFNRRKAGAAHRKATLVCDSQELSGWPSVWGQPRINELT